MMGNEFTLDLKQGKAAIRIIQRFSKPKPGDPGDKEIAPLLNFS